MQKIIKVLMLGEQKVGKENIVEAIQKKDFFERQATIGVEFLVTHVEVAKKKVKLQWWLPSGNPRYQSLVPMYVRDAQIVCLVFDISNKSTFEKLKYWQDIVNASLDVKDYRLIIIGNKFDLQAQQREVTSEQAYQFAKDNNATYIEVSAKVGTNIDELIADVTKIVADLNSGPKELVDEQSTNPALSKKLQELRNYAGILKNLKDKEYFSSGSEKKSQAIKNFLASPLSKDSLKDILEDENHLLVKNRNIFGNGFFRIKSKILGHTNPLRDGRACVSDTEWKLVQIYNALPGSGQDDGLDLSQDSQSSSDP